MPQPPEPGHETNLTQSPAGTPLAWIAEALEARRRDGILRIPAVREVDPLKDFSSNDYLALRHDPRLLQAGLNAASRCGAGAGSSPAVGGWSPAFEELVEALTAWKRAEAALVFSSGYAANVSAVAALVAAGDAVYADKAAHACLIDGARVSGARLRVFPHNDLDRLDEILKRDEGQFRRRLIVTESLFSMDGDQAPLGELAALALRHGAMAIVDEAHASGVFGPEGQGLVEAAGLGHHPAIVRMGTLSKAVGCQGGYVVGSRDLVNWLIQAGRGWIYSTALAPFLAGAAAESIRLIRQADDRRARLGEVSAALRTRLVDHGWNVIPGAGPIVPVLIGPAETSVAIGQRLADAGFAVGTIRPPTVPRDTSRLRLSVTAAHGHDEIDRLVAALDLARSAGS